MAIVLIFRLVCVATLMACMTKYASADLLKPSFGVAYASVGYVQPALDHRFVVLDIELPSYTPLNFLDELKINCDNVEYEAFNHDMCRDFQILVDSHVESCIESDKTLALEIKQITDLLPNTHKETLINVKFQDAKSRRKRLIPLLIPIAFGVASGILNIANTIDMRRKIGILKDSVTILEKNQYELNQNFLQLHGDVADIVQITTQEFDNVYSELNRTNHNVRQLVIHMKENMHEIIKALKQTEYVMKNSFRQLTSYTMAVASMIDATNKHYASMQWYLNSYKQGLVHLMQGELPPALIPPHQLREVLDKTAKILYHTNPSYELVFDSVAHYYRKTDIMYTVQGDHLLVVMPLLLKKVNQKPMELFRIEQCYVPYIVQNVTADTATSYTKVKIETDFIAIGDHNFVELSHAQLDSCTNYNDLYLCERHILQVHESSLTCSSAIFWDADPKDINLHCEFIYIHRIRPSPCILEAEDLVLLTNMGNHWSFRCTHDNLPQRMVGSNFAVIHRDNFCSCALVGKDYFIPQRMRDCKDRPDKVELLFPINAAVATVFYKDIHNKGLLRDMSALYKTPQDLEIPELNLTLSEIDPEVLIDNDLTQSIDLKKIAKAIRARHEVYLDRQEKNRHNQSLKNWFSGMETLSMSITFVLALIGTCAAFVAIYNCVKGHRVMALFGAMSAKVPVANALTFPEDCVSVPYVAIIRERCFQILIVVTLLASFCLMKHLYKRWSVIKILIPETVAIHKGAMTHLHLEFGNPVKGLSKIYLCTVHTTVLNLEMTGSLEIHDVTLHLAKYKTHGILKLVWPTTTFRILHDTIEVKLPDIAYVSIWSYWKLRTILTEPHMERVLLTYDGLTYVLTKKQIQSKVSDDQLPTHSKKPEDQMCNVMMPRYQPSYGMTLLNNLNLKTPTAPAPYYEVVKPKCEIPPPSMEYFTCNTTTRSKPAVLPTAYRSASTEVIPHLYPALTRFES